MESRGVLVPPREVNRFRKALHRCQWLQQLRAPAHGDRFARHPPPLAADDHEGAAAVRVPSADVAQPEPAAVGSWRYMVLSPAGERALLEGQASATDLGVFLRDCGLTCPAELHQHLVSCHHAAGAGAGAGGAGVSQTEGYVPPADRRRAAHLAAVAAADVGSVAGDPAGLEHKLGLMQAWLPDHLSAAAVAPTVPRRMLADPPKLRARGACLSECAACVPHWSLDGVPATNYAALLGYSLEHLRERASAVAALPAKQQERVAMNAAMQDNDAAFCKTIKRLARESTARPSGAAAGGSGSGGECEDDDEAGRSEPVWSVTLETVDEVAATTHAGASKFIHCRDHGSTGDEQRLAAAAVASGASLLSVSAKMWAGLLQNVPGLGEGSSVTTTRPSTTDRAEDRTGCDHQRVIAVRKRPTLASRQSPILVVSGLEVAGNVGTIIRTAVQANAFEEIVIIDPADGSDRVIDKDIGYYSVMNSPLATIRRFETAGQFLAHVRSDPDLVRREMVATSLGAGSINAYSSAAKAALTSPSGILLLLGSEGEGLPTELLESSTIKLRIPSLSSSINVANAFSIVLTVMLMQ